MAQTRKYGSSVTSFGGATATFIAFKTFSWAGGSVANIQDGTDATGIFSFQAATCFAELFIPDTAIPDNASITLSEWAVRASCTFGTGVTASFPSKDGSAVAGGWATDAGFYNEFVRTSAVPTTGALAKLAGYGVGHNAAGNTGLISEFCLRLTFTLPSPTGVTTTAATLVTPSTATLNGTFNPNSATSTYPCSYFFQYGTTAAYGATTTTVGGQTGSGNMSASANLIGLIQNTTYHYRLVVTNADGTSLGSDMTFLTASPDSVIASF